FLVLGWPSGSEDDFFRAAAIKGPVRQVPNDPGEPLHVTANRDGIWLTCSGASLLGQYHHPRSGGGGGGGWDGRRDGTLAAVAPEVDDPFHTMGLGAGAAQTLRVEDFVDSLKQVRARAAGTKHRVDPEVHQARLRHLCRLIVRDRQGFCPINGV